MCKLKSCGTLLNNSCKCLRVCILILFFLFVNQIVVNATTSTCTSSSNCTLREWLTKLREESSSLECALSQLEKSTALLSKVNYSTTSMRLSQIAKLKKSISNLKGEIEIINLTCSTFYGPDCNLTTPECDSKCISCGSAGQCSVCSGNWNGTTCSTCKLGWNGTDCNTPICDSKCITCASPGQCTICQSNWDGPGCSVCKSGWNGTYCNIPICDSKCTNCSAPGICSNCTGNWNGTTCSQCKSGWNGIDCNTPICSSNCASCSAPNVCPTCKTGWTGIDCNTIALILTNAQITKFTSLIMSNAQITTSKLLYKASIDGFSASAFHSKCDNKGPTIVIIKATSGAIFGGYTSVYWNSVTGCTSDTFNDNAFLFSLVSSTGVERFTKLTFQNSYYYKIWLKNNNPCAVYNSAAYGPIFGGGHDMYISDNSNSNYSGSSLCYSYCDTTMSSGDSVAPSYLAGSSNFKVTDYEVYLL